MATWIQTAIGPHLQELTLSLTTTMWVPRTHFSLGVQFWKFLNAPKICVPSSLKNFTLTFIEIEELQIDTPSLEPLSITVETRCSHFSVTNLQNVVEAHLDLNGVDDHFDFALKLLRALTRTQVLVLRRSTLESPPILDFPQFGFLLRLELTVPYVNPKFLVNLLEKCGMLQVFTMQWEDPWSFGSLTHPINDPNCLRSHLIGFECRGYQGLCK